MEFANPSQPIDPNLPTIKINYYSDIAAFKKQKGELCDLFTSFFKDPLIQLQIETAVVESLALFNVFDLDEVRQFLSREATIFLSNYKAK